MRVRRIHRCTRSESTAKSGGSSRLKRPFRAPGPRRVQIAPPPPHSSPHGTRLYGLYAHDSRPPPHRPAWASPSRCRLQPRVRRSARTHGLAGATRRSGSGLAYRRPQRQMCRVVASRRQHARPEGTPSAVNVKTGEVLWQVHRAVTQLPCVNEVPGKPLPLKAHGSPVPISLLGPCRRSPRCCSKASIHGRHPPRRAASRAGSRKFLATTMRYRG